MRHKDLLSRWPQRLAALGRCLVALAVYIGVLALVIVGSHMQTESSSSANHPFPEHPIVAILFLLWWIVFPLIAGMWVRSYWWVPLAWLGPLLLNPIAPALGAEQLTAFLTMMALIASIVGVIIGRWSKRQQEA